MDIGESLRAFMPVGQPVEPPEGASVHMRDLIAVLNGKPFAFNEREALSLVDEPFQRLKVAPAEERLAFVFEALSFSQATRTISLDMAMRGIVSKLLRDGLPLSALDAVRLVETVSERRRAFPYKSLLSCLSQLQMTPALKDALLRLRPMIDYWHGTREMDEIHERIDALVHGKVVKPAAAVSGWTEQVFSEIDRSTKRFEWHALMIHARSLTQSTAPRKWQVEAAAHVDKIGRAEFVDAAHRWLALGPMPGMPQMQQMPDDEADYQKGFIWTLGAMGDTAIAPAIGDFAFSCFRKIPQIGAVSHRVGNACVNALAEMPGLGAVTQLSRLAMRVKYDVALRLIEKALAKAAERNNVSRDDLEAMSVPSFGLSDNGVRTVVCGNSEARLEIQDGGAALSWSRDGRVAKSVPAEVKSNHAELLAEIKKDKKELDAVLTTQRLRLERLLLSQAACRMEDWRAWYIDHPVTSILAKRLVWEIETDGAVQTAAWWDGRLSDWAGNPVTTAPTSAVRLWHPIRSQVQEVLSWRCWFEDRGVCQPFKQSHREVYLLTDAERETATYSNRFASHIVQQHQFSALLRQRGWQFNLMGEWDSHNTPYLELPRQGLRAEFDVDFSGDTETSGHSVYRTISTGRVQFFAIDPKPRRFDFTQRSPLDLAGISPVVFSEVMRDIDLLVSVTSIGTDPNWSGERDDPHAEYWLRFADGDLSTLAEDRKAMVEKLLPKLTIRDRCRVEGRYLFVRGEKNEYRIHLGSGNVIMEPGSKYLCIVRGAGDTAAKVPLPFEGDTMLAVILSKAFLLANDKAIKDELIKRQIG